MQKIFLLLMICFSSCSGGNTVYLCNGPQSEVYHKTSHCQGLRRCSTEIEAVDINTAKARDRRACGYCFRK